MRGRIGLWSALMVLAASSAAAGEAAVGELIGLSPVEVRARLTGTGADGPVPRGFEIARDGGADVYLTLDELIADPRMLRRRAAWRTHGELAPDPDTPVCRSRLASQDRDLTIGDPVLAFRDGRLEAVLRPAGADPKPPPPPREDRKAYERWIRQGRAGPFQARFGQLPLEDGAAFLGRWEAGRLGPSERLSVGCAPAPKPPAVSRPARRPPLTESDLQGLAMAPLVLALPAMNGDRARARERGAATLAELRVGMRLPPDPGAFARSRDGLRWHASARPGYGVLTVDLGGGRTRNLSDARDAVLVGVQDGAVTWISPPAGAGPGAGLLCLDAEGQAGTPRPGCHGWGVYRP